MARPKSKRVSSAQKPLGLFGGGKPVQVRIGGREITLISPNRRLARAIEKARKPRPEAPDERREEGSPF